jgi:hypothetical protein
MIHRWWHISEDRGNISHGKKSHWMHSSKRFQYIVHERSLFPSTVWSISPPFISIQNYITRNMLINCRIVSKLLSHGDLDCMWTLTFLIASYWHKVVLMHIFSYHHSVPAPSPSSDSYVYLCNQSAALQKQSVLMDKMEWRRDRDYMDHFTCKGELQLTINSNQLTIARVVLIHKCSHQEYCDISLPHNAKSIIHELKDLTVECMHNLQHTQNPHKGTLPDLELATWLLSECGILKATGICWVVKNKQQYLEIRWWWIYICTSYLRTPHQHCGANTDSSGSWNVGDCVCIEGSSEILGKADGWGSNWWNMWAAQLFKW